jgi:hypothetical protein
MSEIDFETIKAMARIVAQYGHEERRHFEECGPKNRNNHIWKDLERAGAWLKKNGDRPLPLSIGRSIDCLNKPEDDKDTSRSVGIWISLRDGKPIISLREHVSFWGHDLPNEGAWLTFSATLALQLQSALAQALHDADKLEGSNEPI